MDNICKVCSIPFLNDAALHKHLKKHGLLVAKYWQKYYPRYDKYDNSLILFKNKKQYFETDFNSRINFKKWIDTQPIEITQPYCKTLLINRVQKKALKWAPTQVELRSTMLPPVQYYDKIFGGYYEICKEIGIESRFSGAITDLGAINKTNKFKIVIDTREQQPLLFPSHDIQRAGLKFGDYSADNPEDVCGCYFERKNPQDFINTLSSGFERFKRELDKAKAASAYLIVLVEASLNSCLDFKHSGEFYKKTKITPEYVFHNVRDLLQTYDNLQFLFVSGRGEAVQAIERIFKSGCNFKHVDLQWYYDTNKLLCG